MICFLLFKLSLLCPSTNCLHWISGFLLHSLSQGSSHLPLTVFVRYQSLRNTQAQRVVPLGHIKVSLCWRQQGSRYTIYAICYLCDKEFCYLKTIRIIVVVYQGFYLKLRTFLLFTFQHRASVRLYTSSYHLIESCVFNKQSLPPSMCRFPTFLKHDVDTSLGGPA